MADTKIEWANKVWNPVTGCSKISPGCLNCYAERMAKRLAGRFGYPVDNHFSVTIHPHRLGEPAAWRKSKRVFVCSMADLFHEEVPVEFLLQIFGRMNAAKHHIFMLLTKRPENVLDFCMQVGLVPSGLPSPFCSTPSGEAWPKNVGLGCTAENQEMADKRIPILLQIPAEVRFVSIEPMLGSVDISSFMGSVSGCTINCPTTKNSCRAQSGDCRLSVHTLRGIDWVICGGESGPKARYMNPEWASSIKRQCKKNNVPFFMKQMSGKTPIPDFLQGREFPEI